MFTINFTDQIIAANEKKTLNKPFRTPNGPKKFAVYTKNDKGNVVKVNFGDPNMEIKRDQPERRKNYRARHHCDSGVGPKWKANYWSCKMWESKKSVSDVTKGEVDNQKQFWKKVKAAVISEEWDGQSFAEEAQLLKINPKLKDAEEVPLEDENQELSASDSDFEIGAEVVNTNPNCKHYGSEGYVQSINDLPEFQGSTVSYKVTNDGETFKKGDVLTKTRDQLSKKISNLQQPQVSPETDKLVKQVVEKEVDPFIAQREETRITRFANEEGEMEAKKQEDKKKAEKEKPKTTDIFHSGEMKK